MTELAARLAAWRADERPDEARCLVLFGVGRETLQRIERGEVEPEPDIAERIRTFTALPGPTASSRLGSIPSPGAPHAGGGDGSAAAGAFSGSGR